MTQPPPEPRYEVARKGSPLGIHSLAELSQLIANGTLLWSDDCWTEGMESWCKLSDLRERIEGSSLPPQYAGSPRRILTYISLATAVVLAIGLTAYFIGSGPAGTESHMRTTAPTTPPAPLTTEQRTLRLSLSALQQQIVAKVAGSFVERNEEATGRRFYVHNYYLNIGNRIPLRVFVDVTGRRHLYTYYQGKTWIFHTQLRFTFDRQTLETRPVPAYKALRDIGDDNVVTESCRFLDSDDEKVLARLASASASAINMQMVGRKPMNVALSYETKQAIKESFELSELLAKREKLVLELNQSL